MGRLQKRFLFSIVLSIILLAGLSGHCLVFADTTVDNHDSSTSQTGVWTVSGGTNPYDADSVWARGGDDTFTWHFTPTESGNYEVWEWHSGWSSRTTAAPHQITYAGGSQTVPVNQKTNAGQWNSLGVYAFEAGVGYEVTVTSVADASSTCADAVRWTLVTAGPSAPTAYIDSITPNPANEGETITFTGHGSDADGTIAAYRWISSIDGTLSNSASFSISTLSVGTHTISLEVQDNDGAWSVPVTQILSVYGTPGTSTEVIIDNQDANTSKTGEWPVSGGTNPYDADSVWERGGDDTFTWHFTPTESGNYEVWEWHSGWSSRTTAAPHQITYAGGSQTVPVNQKINAGKWNSLGVYYFEAYGSYEVTVTSVADASSTCADAVRWTLVTAGPSAPIAYIDSITPNPANEGETITFTGHGSDADGTIAAYRWISSIDGTLSNSASFSISTLSVGTHTISLEVQDNDGAWSVPVIQSLSVSGPSAPTAYIDSITPNPANEGETITFTGHGSDADGSIATCRWISSINGTLSNDDSFSISTLSVGTHTISLEMQDNDGTWSVPVTRSLTVNDTSGTSTEVIIDNQDANTSKTGVWTVSGGTNPYDADSVWARGGDDTFTWHFSPTESGNYEVWEWHSGWSSRPIAAPHRITYAGGNQTVPVNQKINAGKWNSLGVYYFEAGGSYEVTVTSLADASSTCADAVRWTLGSVGGIPPVAVIDSISPGSPYEGQSVSFVGHGSDADGSIAAYRWISSIDGTLSNSASFSISTLSLGTHTISLEVQDNDGAWSVPVTRSLTVVIYDVSEEHIYYCPGFGGGTYAEAAWVINKTGALKDGDIWRYTNLQGKKFVIHIVQDVEGMRQALMTSGAHVLYRGHSNYGVGAAFATEAEQQISVIDNIYTIDDPRVFNISSPWIHVNVRGLITSQAWPNWWPIFQDGTSGIMPYDFGDPRGDPPYNYYITYQIPGDPTGTHYMLQSANLGPIERFPDSGRPAWYAADGSSPNPANPDHLQYFITNPEPWSPSVEVTGDWNSSMDPEGYFRDNYYWLPAGTGLNAVEYLFTIPEPGQYRIEAWWPESADNTASAKYTVYHDSGSSDVFIDQRTNGGMWNEIGIFDFSDGEYSVLISDQTASGRVIADGVRITAMENPPSVIQADFNAETRYGPAPLEVDFDSESTGDITALAWDLGDGYTNTTRTRVTHIYTTPGTYTVSFTVSGPDGTSTVTKPGYIIVGNGAEPLHAEFAGNRQEGTVPLESSFEDVSSGPIYSWSWDFDDDGIEDSTEPSPAHTYLEPGNYTVVLTVTDADGNTSTERKPNFVIARLMDKSIDNVDYPKTHYQSKTILFRKDLEVPKDQLRYKRLFYEACNSGNYYLDTFSHGIVFYTVNSSTGLGFYTYLINYLEGKSDQQIWEAMQSRDPVYDYYDFNKLPSQQ